jgi:hypothetical protein
MDTLCKNCGAFDAFNPEDSNSVGFCRINPPVLVMTKRYEKDKPLDEVPMGLWPMVHCEEWCEAFHPNEKFLADQEKKENELFDKILATEILGKM